MVILPQIYSFLPEPPHGFWRYNGGLTTPTCDEKVVWTVLNTTIGISANQVRPWFYRSSIQLVHTVYCSNFCVEGLIISDNLEYIYISLGLRNNYHCHSLFVTRNQMIVRYVTVQSCIVTSSTHQHFDYLFCFN